MPRLVIASSNPGKLREFAALVAPLGFDAVGQDALGLGEAEEPHPTFIENALAKARHASVGSGLAALADDSGLCVGALGGLPGVRSARYADDEADSGADAGAAAFAALPRAERDRRNNGKLIAALTGDVPPDAYFVCVLAFLRRADDPEPIVTVGRWPGRIVAVPRGLHGFGYDAHFLPAGEDRTAAELDLAVKNRISHRAIAMRLLADALRDAAVGGSDVVAEIAAAGAARDRAPR